MPTSQGAQKGKAGTVHFQFVNSPRPSLQEEPELELKDPKSMFSLTARFVI